jgi:tetratricopeptide (TPR) repeat protein
MSLSVCLLTRNDAGTVARAVRSVRDVADEVLVADTASADDTARIAAGAGAAVTQFTWEDDFAAGRNYLIGRAISDWILWLDPKEELAPGSIDALRSEVARTDAFGFFLRIWREGYSETADLRLFRRRADLRFIGRLHPHFEPGVIEAVKREGLAVGPCDVALLHHEQAGPPGEAKLRWTLKLLELELRDRPGQLHYLIEQGRTLLRLKDPRGHVVMAKAAEQVRVARDEAAPPSGKVQVLLKYWLTTPSAQGPLTPDDARELVMRWFPDSPALLWLLAGQRFAAGEFAEAADLLKRLIRLGQTGTYDRSQAFEQDIIGDRALLNLGACYLKLGRWAEAEACFLQLTPSPVFGAEAARQLQLARSMKPTR